MKAERARLVRLQRLERVRAIAKQTAASEAAQAQGTLAQLEALADRTYRMAEVYAARGEVTDGASLRHLGSFTDGLRGIAQNATIDAARARNIADSKVNAP